MLMATLKRFAIWCYNLWAKYRNVACRLKSRFYSKCAYYSVLLESWSSAIKHKHWLDLVVQELAHSMEQHYQVGLR